MSGGERVAKILAGHGVEFLFTLCGGHISPILVAAKALGLRVVDVRDEASAVFAADAVARLTGVPGVAAVTAGPGVTNAITAVKNAQLAQSPIVLIGGATATMLKGRGALQDIDQLTLIRPHVKHAVTVKRLRDLDQALIDALRIAREGVPGPTFVECPVDLLYDEDVVRGWYASAAGGTGGSQSLGGRLRGAYLNRHLNRLFGSVGESAQPASVSTEMRDVSDADVARAAARLAKAERPVLLIGSQAVTQPEVATELRDAIGRLGAPVYFSGMARGLLGPSHELLMRHHRRKALREADLVLLAGVPCDFRLGYGRTIPGGTFTVSINRSRKDLTLNRRPTLAVHGDPARFLVRMAGTIVPNPDARASWVETLRGRDTQRETEIEGICEQPTEFINPLALCRAIDRAMGDDSRLVLDGGDFVAASSYVTRPRMPLGSLDPGPFGTLGVGAGFALGAKLVRPESEVWLLYGDGSAAYSVAEFDTFVRHGAAVIAVVGNDGCWTQIAREQRKILKDGVGTELVRNDYHRVVEGYGGVGLEVERIEDVDGVLAEARAIAAAGRPVLINAKIGETDFRSGSISI